MDAGARDRPENLHLFLCVYSEGNGSLGMELYCNDDEVNGSINEELVEHKVLGIETMKPVARASVQGTLIRPG
jgi:hypothetical protein